ncbi:uncharacterized protein TNCV_550811 [Trichonephila clavipes]|nr:uncharacterized protein TNCV_550811 [Trichonephila clavipes]
MLPVLGKKAVLKWCNEEGLIGSSYVCPKCGKSMELRERTVYATVGFDEHEQMFLSGGQSVAKHLLSSSQANLTLILPTQRRDERLSRPCPTRRTTIQPLKLFKNYKHIKANRRIARNLSRNNAAIRRCWPERINSGIFQCQNVCAQAHYEQLSEYERGHIIELKEAGWANRRIVRHLGRNDATIRRCWPERVNSGIFQCQNVCAQAHYEQLSEYERGHIIGLKEAGWANRRIARHLGGNDAAIRRCCQERFSDDSRLQLYSDDPRGRVWRRPQQRADPAFTIAHRTGHQPGVMV